MEEIKINIVLDKKNGIPLYLQVKKQIMDQIQKGDIKIGSKMPTERELASNLNVSRNTVSSAYKELEQQGIIKSYQGKGTFVEEEARIWKHNDLKDKLSKFIDLALEEAIEAGIETEEFLELVHERVDKKRILMDKLVAVYAECNIEQAKMFSKELSKRCNMNVIPLTIGDFKEMKPKTLEILNSSQVIITTFNHVNEITELTKGVEKEVLGVAINPDLGTIVKIARYPSTTKFGFVCISVEFMYKIKGALKNSGLDEIDVEYSNSYDENELKKFIASKDVIVVSPGRHKDVDIVNKNLEEQKELIEFLYTLDDGSVKALKSKMIEALTW